MLLACTAPESGERDGGDGGIPAEGACTDDLECAPDGGDPSLFRCNLTHYRCEAACRTRADCGAESRGEYALSFCDGPMGCQCQEGRCVQALCSVDADCGEGSCRNGECLPPGQSAAAPARCELVPPFAVVSAGAELTFTVLARDADAVAIPMPKGFVWSAQAVVTELENDGVQARYAFPTQTAEPVELIRTTLGEVSCSARVHVVPVDATAGIAQALVVDAQTGRPVEGATVQLTGTLDSGAELTPVLGETDGQGLVRLALAGELGLATLSTYHRDYEYLTVIDLPVVDGALDLLLPLERDATVGGYQGTLGGVPATPNVHAAFAGDSRTPFLNLPNGLFGAPVPTDVSLGAWTETAAPLPSSVYLGSADGGIKTTVTVDSPPGSCAVAPPGFASAEEAERAGRCGVTTAWAFSLDAPLLSLPLDALASGVATANWSSAFERFIPLLREFNSTVERDVDFAAAPVDAGIPAAYAPVDLPFAQLPMRIRFAVRVPALPTFAGRYLDSALVLGLTEVPGRGAVPLGLGLAVNRNLGDALTDPQEGLSSQGLVSVKMAPTHHGLEGNPYTVAATALWREGGPGERFGSSTLVERLGRVSLPYDPGGASPIELSHPFLPLPERVRFHSGETSRLGLRSREVRLEQDDRYLQASLAQAVFLGRGNKRWRVVAAPAVMVAGVVVPRPPPSFEDLLHDGALRAKLTVELVRLEEPQTAKALTVGAFFDRRWVTLERQRLLPVSTSQVQHGRPSVDWVSPGEGAAVRFGSELRARVLGFSLGTLTPFRRVVFEVHGCGSVWPLLTTPDPSRPREVVALAPLGCTGPAQLVARVEEYANPDWIELDPPVQSTQTVTLGP
ncbi:MAG: hypothetical protein M3Y59_07090 [Myxococcota bacterium]|nr:hypothetical protein [Myxococcota bacterium]